MVGGGSVLASFTNSVERINSRQIYIDYCTIIEIDRDGTPGVKCHSPDHVEYYNTVSLKIRSTKINNTDPQCIQHVNALVLQHELGNHFGCPYTPRVGDLVAVLFMYNAKPLILGPVATTQQKPFYRSPTSEDAKYDYVNKWCQWLRPSEDKNKDYFDHPKGRKPICFKRFHGPVTGRLGKGRDEMTVWDCKKGDKDTKCTYCKDIDSIDRTEQFEKIYSSQTESNEAPPSRWEHHALCGSCIRFESESGYSKEYSEGRGHLFIENANDDKSRGAHLNFQGYDVSGTEGIGTCDLHTTHEEKPLATETEGVRFAIVDPDDPQVTWAYELMNFPVSSYIRNYKNGDIKLVSPTDITLDAIDDILLEADDEITLDAPDITLDGNVLITGTITHGDDQSCAEGDAKLDGAAGGQTLCGGTAASECLTLQATKDVTQGTVKIQPSSGGCSIGPVTNPAATLCVGGGCCIGGANDPGDDNLYIVGNCSAESYTDRTPSYSGNALKDISKISSDEFGNIDHDTLPEFVRRLRLDDAGNEIIERDLGNMVSVLTKATQELLDIINNQNIIIEKLNKRLEKIEKITNNKKVLQ